MLGAIMEERSVRVCCPSAVHEAMKRDDLAWARLEYVGLQDDGDGGWLELRNCPCGGTLGRAVEVTP